MLQRRPSRSLLLLAAALVAGSMALARPAAAANGWVAASPMPGLAGGRIWGVAAQPSQPNTLIAATDAGIYMSRDGGVPWLRTLAGMRAWTVGFDQRTPNVALAGTSGRGVFISTDAGSTWAASAGLMNQDVRTFAFGLDGIAAGTDAGVALSPDGRNWHDGGLDDYSISALAVVANSPQFTIIAGADSGRLASGYLFSSTAGGAWEVLQSGLPAEAVVSSLTDGPIDQAVPKRPLLVTTSQGTFRSGDGGTTWSASSGAPMMTILTTALYSPLDPNLVYAGADAGGSTGGGIFRSTDGGVTFSSPTPRLGLPSSENVVSISITSTTPPTVILAIDPPSGAVGVYSLVDTTAPPPPVLTPEAPGASVPTAVATPRPTPTPTPHAVPPAPPPPPPNPVAQFAAAAFHWPFPLVYEVIFVLLAVYVFIRWRQRYYVEGPP